MQLLYYEDYMANASDFIVLDCQNDMKEYDQGKEKFKKTHLPRAYHVPIKPILTDDVLYNAGRHPLPKINFLYKLFTILIERHETQKFLVYSDGIDIYSARMIWLLQLMGFTNVYLLNETFSSLRQKYNIDLTVNLEENYRNEQLTYLHEIMEDEVEQHKITSKGKSSLYELYQEVLAEQDNVINYDFVYQLNRNLISTHMDVFDAIKQESLILDVRHNARFIGENEPIDTTAGHIPQTFNLEYEHYIDEGRITIQKLNQLKLEYSHLYNVNRSLQSDIREDRDVILSCGSGLSACMMYVLLQLINVPSSVYAGSYSEWIALDLPILNNIE